MSAFVSYFLTAALAVLGVFVLFALLYAILGKRFTDKIVATNMIGTLCVNMIVIVALLVGADYILDVALVFALLSFLTVVVLCRFVQSQALARRKSGERKEDEA